MLKMDKLEFGVLETVKLGFFRVCKLEFVVLEMAKLGFVRVSKLVFLEFELEFENLPGGDTHFLFIGKRFRGNRRRMVVLWVFGWLAGCNGCWAG